MEKRFFIFVLGLLVAVALFTQGCEEPDEEYLVVPDFKKATLKKDGIDTSSPQIDNDLDGDRVHFGDFNCYMGNRLEFDVYDSNDEFINPKNYSITLVKSGGDWQGKRAFSQYCTQNNTVTFYNIGAGSYSYILTSSCTSKTYRGRLLYNGGYQARLMYIDQSLCD